MDDSFLKIKILERPYSLKINPKDEEILKQAEKLLDKQIRQRKAHLKVHDKQDLLAMIAFDYAVETIKQQMSEQEITEKLNKLTNTVSGFAS